MAHEQQERYSDLVLAKMRDSLVLKDGVVFNNDYEGNPAAGSVKIPVRDAEVQVSDYDKANGITATTGTTTYQTLTINKDKAVGEIIDGYDAEAVPANLVADRLDSAGYSLAKTIDTDGATVLLAEGTAYNAASVDASSAYDLIVDVRRAMSKANVPTEGRYLLATPDFYAMLLKDKDHFVGASGLGDQIKQTGAVGKIAGFTVYEFNDDTAGLMFIAGHPRFAARVSTAVDMLPDLLITACFEIMLAIGNGLLDCIGQLTQNIPEILNKRITRTTSIPRQAAPRMPGKSLRNWHG